MPMFPRAIFHSVDPHYSHSSVRVRPFAGESTDALQTSGLSAFTASESYNFILAASLLLSAAATAHAAV